MSGMEIWTAVDEVQLDSAELLLAGRAHVEHHVGGLQPISADEQRLQGGTAALGLGPLSCKSCSRFLVIFVGGVSVSQT